MSVDLSWLSWELVARLWWVWAFIGAHAIHAWREPAT